MSTIKEKPVVAVPDSPPLQRQRDPRMMEAAKSFENQFIRQMISEMRKTVPKDELVDEGMTGDIFRGKLDDEYANTWTDKGGIGLADLIYQQMEERYSPQKINPKQAGEFLKLSQSSAQPVKTSQQKSSSPIDILDKADKSLFIAKKIENGLDIRSAEPLPEQVPIRSPLSGVVLQAATMQDGRQALVIMHDNGLVSQFVHTGHNHVKTNVRVAAGEVIADLPPSQNGESANIFFGLRKASKVE